MLHFSKRKTGATSLVPVTKELITVKQNLFPLVTPSLMNQQTLLLLSQPGHQFPSSASINLACSSSSLLVEVINSCKLKGVTTRFFLTPCHYRHHQQIYRDYNCRNLKLIIRNSEK